MKLNTDLLCLSKGVKYEVESGDDVPKDRAMLVKRDFQRANRRLLPSDQALALNCFFGGVW